MIATCVISGLPNVPMKDVDLDQFHVASGMSDGLTKSKRPSFMNRNKTVSSKNPVSKINGIDVRNN